MTKSEKYYIDKGYKTIKTKNCEYCGLEFNIYVERDLERKKYCSKGCSSKQNWVKIKKHFSNGTLNNKAIIGRQVEYIKFKCSYCGIENEIAPHRFKNPGKLHFCNQKCFFNYKRVEDSIPITFKCDNCEIISTQSKYKYDKHKNHFCSINCVREYRFKHKKIVNVTPRIYNKIKFNCENCKSISFQSPSRYNKCKLHFCSQNCHHEYKNKQPAKCKIAFVCAMCNKEFVRFRTMVTSKTPCCSRKCRGEYRTKHGTGKTELTVPLRKLIKGCKLYDNWRESIYKRDNFLCVKCHKKGYLNAHHIKSFSIIFNEFLKQYSHLSPLTNKRELFDLSKDYFDFWDISNGETLCEECHQKEHPKLNLTLSKSPCKLKIDK